MIHLKIIIQKLPENISPKIKEWVNKNNVSTKEEFIEKIYKRFSDGSYFYNLKSSDKLFWIINMKTFSLILKKDTANIMQECLYYLQD